MHVLLAAILLSWRAPNLTPAQRAWCEHFARDAATMTIARLPQSAADARVAKLPLVAEYLERVCGDDALAAERALQASAHGPVVVIARRDGDRIVDLTLGVHDPDDDWLTSFAQRLPQFERSLPGYRATWQHDDAPRGAHAIADLALHVGTSAQSTAPAAYLQFDASLRATAGRSFIHWKNMTIASWYERELRPVAEVLHAGAASGESLSRWYALRFLVSAVGPKSPRSGETWAPIAVATQDVVAVLASDFLHDLDLPTFLAVTFHTLNDAVRGGAPQQHRPASCLVLNWCMRHGGIRASPNGWRIDKRAMMRSLRALTNELLAIEASGDEARGARLLADYGSITPLLQATLYRLPPPNAPKTEVRFAILEER